MMDHTRREFGFFHKLYREIERHIVHRHYYTELTLLENTKRVSDCLKNQQRNAFLYQLVGRLATQLVKNNEPAHVIRDVSGTGASSITPIDFNRSHYSDTFEVPKLSIRQPLKVSYEKLKECVHQRCFDHVVTIKDAPKAASVEFSSESMLLLVVILLAALPAASPCSGGSGGCCMRQQQPIVVSCQQQSCQSGYTCGQYGCARRKAFGGLTKRIDGVIVDEEGEKEQAHVAHSVLAMKTENVHATNVSHERLTNPNFIFRSCCEARGLPDSCTKHCHFNTYTAEVLEAMFQKRDDCPIEAVNEIHYCAAQGIDHSECCTSEGVSETVAGDKCLAFCDQRPNRFTPVDSSYLPCFDVFESMKKCFYLEIKKRADKKFSHRNFLNDGNSNGAINSNGHF